MSEVSDSRRQKALVLADLIRRRWIDPMDADVPRLWSITAPPGMGKSFVLDAVATMVTTHARVVRATADELTGRTPLAVAAALMGHTVGYPPQENAMTALLSELDRMCASGPMVMMIDDAHWADQESLLFMQHAVEAAGDLPVAVIYARRSVPTRRRLDTLEALPVSMTVELEPLTDAEMSGVAEAVLGAPAGGDLRAMLAALGGSPLHAVTLLEHLKRGSGLVRAAGPDGSVFIDSETRGDRSALAQSMATALRVQINQLDRSARSIADTVAVWGEAMSLTELAGIRGTPLVSTTEDAQLAVLSGLLRWDSVSSIDFHHGLHRDVVYSLLSDPVRRVLHTACADLLTVAGAPATVAARHTALAARYGRHYPPAVAALTGAASQVESTPAAAAQLWKDADTLVRDADEHGISGESGVSVDERVAVATGHAVSLARSGSLLEAAHVAAAALRGAVAPHHRGVLRSVQISSLVATARIADAVTAVDDALTAPLPQERRSWLLDLRRWIVLLGGAEQIEFIDGAVDVDASATALVEAGVRACLTGRGLTGTDLLDRAFEKTTHGGNVGSDGATGAVWPLWAKFVTDGPTAAEAELSRYREVFTTQEWLNPYHGFVTGAIKFSTLRWDDAVAEWDSALEQAAHHGSGWISMAVGPRVMIDAVRGDITAARRRLEQWDIHPRPDQFGLPDIDAARASLAGSVGDWAVAAALYRDAWIRAVDSGRPLWAVLHGVPSSHAAAMAGRTEFLEQIVSDLGVLDDVQCPAVVSVREFAVAVLSGSFEQAARAADRFDALGDALGAMWAREEGAVLAARAGDVERAKALAASVTAAAGAAGAKTISRRLGNRLRANGIRTGSTATRVRATTGWDSLTRTEHVVADLIADGVNGPDIAARMFVSPRTVQTHVSRILRKLGLRTRIEIAAAHRTRNVDGQDSGATT